MVSTLNHDVPTLKLGNIAISIETAARQAELRGHSILDEVRVLLVHGLLRLLGFRHDTGDEAAMEMKTEEQLILKNLKWKGEGFTESAHALSKLHIESLDGQVTNGLKRAGSLRFYKPKFKYIFSDMDGTLLDNNSLVTEGNSKAIREAMACGINIVIATGKARPAVIEALNMVGLAGLASDSSPGVYLQGLLVYGLKGEIIYQFFLEKDVCKEALLYSLEHKVPLVAFSLDECFTMYDDPLVDSLHHIYHEPKKILFLETPEGISSVLRPYWANKIMGKARVVQAQRDMLELVPLATSKGNGVKILLDHLSVCPDEVMAIGDGENDIEMLQLAGLGIALANGCRETKAVADVIGASNDKDGVAQAIYEYAF